MWGVTWFYFLCKLSLPFWSSSTSYQHHWLWYHFTLSPFPEHHQRHFHYTSQSAASLSEVSSHHNQYHQHALVIVHSFSYSPSIALFYFNDFMHVLFAFVCILLYLLLFICLNSRLVTLALHWAPKHSNVWQMSTLLVHSHTYRRKDGQMKNKNPTHFGTYLRKKLFHIITHIYPDLF